MTGILLRRETVGPGDTQGDHYGKTQAEMGAITATNQGTSVAAPRLEVETADPPWSFGGSVAPPGRGFQPLEL